MAVDLPETSHCFLLLSHLLPKKIKQNFFFVIYGNPIQIHRFGLLVPHVQDSRMKSRTPLKKGEATRLAILDAALRCYGKFGYARTTQDRIAREAGVSMGALTYHFPSVAELTQAAVQHVFRLRVEKHREAIRESADAATDFEAALEIYWQSVTSPLFVISHELSVAARTDRTLANVLKPAHNEFLIQWKQNLQELHPEWKDAGEMFEFAVQYSTFLTEGMAIRHLLEGMDTETARAVRDFMKDSLEALLAAGKAGTSVTQLLAPGRARRTKPGNQSPG